MAPRTPKPDAPATDAKPDAKPDKPESRWSALTVARHATATLGRPITDKRVRSVARDVIDRYVAAESGGQRAGYTAHAYTLPEVRTIMDALAGKGRGGPTADLGDLTAALADGADAPKADA